MPRPGPRPYECVRRAWHSDTHQPIRGSLIQEIFRIVNQVHCPSTRKNREWQEKLPIVVLKAEEIIYSKAISQAEYSDLQTLWERVNDAIDTIIRRDSDETTETRQLLQPCIEAALHLGCTARRSSRSQRNECPRYYLRPNASEAVSVSGLNAKPFENHTTNSPALLHYSHYFTTDAFSLFHSCFNTDHSSFQGKFSNDSSAAATVPASDGKKFPALFKDSTPIGIHEPQQISSSSKAWSIYPLDHDQNLNSLKPSNSHSIRLMGSYKPALQQSPPSIKNDVSVFIIPSNCERSSDNGHGNECDLTLRLGSISAPQTGIECTAPLRVVTGHASMLEGRKFMDMGHLQK